MEKQQEMNEVELKSLTDEISSKSLTIANLKTVIFRLVNENKDLKKKAKKNTKK